jgi:hypothetical protein
VQRVAAARSQPHAARAEEAQKRPLATQGRHRNEKRLTVPKLQAPGAMRPAPSPSALLFLLYPGGAVGEPTELHTHFLNTGSDPRRAVPAARTPGPGLTAGCQARGGTADPRRGNAAVHRPTFVASAFTFAVAPPPPGARRLGPACARPGGPTSEERPRSIRGVRAPCSGSRDDLTRAGPGGAPPPPPARVRRGRRPAFVPAARGSRAWPRTGRNRLR